MIKEIYIRNNADPNFERGIVDFENDIESAITQVRTILGTKPGDVFGYQAFGIDLDYLVFNTVKNVQDVKAQIKEQLDLYLVPGKNITLDVDVNFGNSGHGYDYAIIDIVLNGRKALGLLVEKD